MLVEFGSQHFNFLTHISVLRYSVSAEKRINKTESLDEIKIGGWARKPEGEGRGGVRVKARSSQWQWCWGRCAALFFFLNSFIFSSTFSPLFY